MQGLGNDFVVMDTIHQSPDLHPLAIKTLADRHIGIGFDQLLLIEKSEKADFACRIFNADGTPAEQCGNGIRCVARFVHEEKLTPKKAFTIETQAGITQVSIDTYDAITADMGVPRFKPVEIPLLQETQQKLYELNLQDEVYHGAILSMGNPHVIIKVSALSSFPITEIGAKIARLPIFPMSCNVGFMQIIDRQHIQLRTFERGVGATLACGTNACAAVVAGIMNEWLDHKVTVQLALGNLIITWEKATDSVKMMGPAMRVFAGVI